MRLGDDAEHSTFAPGTARSLVWQGPLREGEDGRGQSSGQAMEFHLLSQSSGNLLPQSVFSSEWPCLDASVLESSLWYSMGNGLQGWRADQEMPSQEAMWGCRDGTDSGEIRR